MHWDRPDTLVGPTQRIQSGWGKIYITINEDKDGYPVELFVRTGSSGGFTNGFCEAIGMLGSYALQHGGTPAGIANSLLRIRSDRVGRDNGDDIYSVPDAVGIALMRYDRGMIQQSIRNDDNGDLYDVKD